MMHIPRQHALTREAMRASFAYAPIFNALLANGKLDTDEIAVVLRCSLVQTQNKLQQLKNRGLVACVDRRMKKRFRGFAYVSVWAIAPEEQKASAKTTEVNARVAGKITIGRGSYWGASLV